MHNLIRYFTEEIPEISSFLLTALLCLLVSGPVTSMESLSDDKMSSITGKEGITVDLETSNSFTVDLEYIDSDGDITDASGGQGVFTLNNVCIGDFASCGDDMDISGITLDADGSVTVGGSSRGALVVDIPAMSNQPGIQVDGIFPGDPAANSVGSFTLDTNELANTVVEVAALGDGIVADLDLGVSFDEFTFTDNSGYSGAGGNTGELHVEDILVDDGTGTTGTPVSQALTGMSFNVAGDFTPSNQPAMVVGGPSGEIDVSTGNIYPGDESGSPITSGVNAVGIDMSNTNIGIGAK